MAVLGALYGVDYYTGDPNAGAFYGVLRLADFDASPFTATALQHNAVFLQWVTPSGNWSRFRLVRNNYGPPVNEDDGLTLLEGNWGPANLPAWAATPGGRQLQIDTGVKTVATESFNDTDLTPGNFYYYGIFLLSEEGIQLWRPAGSVTGLAPADYGYTDKMLERLPSIFTTEPPAAGEQQGDPGTDLARFMDLFGFHLDTYRTALDGLLQTNNPMLVSGDLIPAMAAQYGVAYEPEVGIAQTRVQIRNAAYIYKHKGTRLGLEAAVSSLSGWGAECVRGANLLLDYNDSSFEESLGRWQAVQGCTVRRRLSDNVIAAYAEPTAPATYPNRQAALMEITSTGAATMAQVRCGADNPVLYGTPVQAGQAYTLSGFLRGDAARTARVSLRWHDARGVQIGTSSSGVNYTLSTTSYTRVWVTSTAPAGAAVAVMALTVDFMPAGEKAYADAFQLEQATAATAFEDARNVRVLLTANRTNEITNPRFLLGTAGWSPLGSGGIAKVTDRGHVDSTSLRVQLGAGEPDTQGARYTFTADQLKPSQNYVASAWVYVPSGGTPVHLQASGDIERTVIGQNTGDVYDQWQRIDVVFQTSEQRVGPISVDIANDSTTSGAVGAVDNGDGTLTLATTDNGDGTVNPTDALVDNSDGTLTVPTGAGGATSLTVVDNGDGTATLTGGTDNGDGTATEPAVDNGDGTATVNTVSAATVQFWVDEVLVERGVTVQAFFDAASYGERPADFLWEGAAHASRSHLYLNRTAKSFRLDALMQRSAHAGSTWSLLFAQTDTVDEVVLVTEERPYQNVYSDDYWQVATAPTNPGGATPDVYTDTYADTF